MKQKFIALIGAITICTSPMAFAEVKINGFGSITAGSASGDNKNLYGYDDTLSFKNESLFALQVSSDLGEKLSVTAQLVGRGSDDFDPVFEWAFVTYDINSEWKVNLGKLRTPFFRYSDFMDVGYAHPWVRVPQSVYNLSFNTIEGISVYKTGTLFDLNSSLQFVGGESSADTEINGIIAPSTVKNVLGAAWEVGTDTLQVRIAYLQGDLSMEISPLNELLQGLSTFGFSEVAQNIEVKDDTSTFTGVGLNYDGENWFGGSEYTIVESKNNFIAKLHSFYIYGGYRFTPDISGYVMYENDDDKAEKSIYQNLSPQLPFTPVVIGLVESQTQKKDTWSIGGRYNFHPSAALKAQFSQQKNTLTNENDSVVSMGIDFVF